MKQALVTTLRWAAQAIGVIFLANSALAEPQIGISMYGDPALPHDFVSLPYANPDAPKGGRIVEGNTGGFDSLNPFVLKGTVPWQLRFYAYESLMTRSLDEPFTLYGLLAESIETPTDRSSVEFTLRPEAKFSDGSPVTVEDVIWSYQTLGTVGHPRYLGFWKKVEKIEQTGPRSIKISFNENNRELALIAGLRPILKKEQWEGRDFAAGGLHDIPIGTAPYVIDDYEAGRFVSLKRNPDYWGKDLPIRRGIANLDEIRIEFFGDQSVLFEAFKSGVLTINREFNAEKWESQYDFPAIQSGEVVKSLVTHERASGMTGLAMNSRRAHLADWRVRQALLEAFNFPYINGTLTGGRSPRITSYFSNSWLASQSGPAEGEVRSLLMPYSADLPPGTIDGYSLPKGDTSPRNRKGLRLATKLLDDAGWTVVDGVLRNAAGDPFELDVVLRQGDQKYSAIIEIYRQALERLGISVNVSQVDNAQFAEREATRDFDMISYRVGLSLSPGNEQYLYWGSQMAEEDGTRNLMGVNSDAVDGMIDTMLETTSRETYLAAVRGLDRILTAGRYVIPIWNETISRVAHASNLKFPENTPIYGDWPGWMPDVWWFEAEQ